MSSRRDGRRCWPTSAAYGAIAASWALRGQPAGRVWRPPHAGDLRAVGQAEELEVRPGDPPRQRDAVFQVPCRLREAATPVLGDTEICQRQRAVLRSGE